jgi:cytochrome c oxidase assembly protein subunit 15
VGTLAQAPLGLLAVKTDLRWPVVMAHLLLSALLVAAAVVLVLETHRLVVGGVSPLVPLELRRVGVVLASSCFLLLVSGTLATAGGPHSGGGKDIRRLWRLEPLVYTHGAVVAVFGCTMLLTVGYLAAQRTRSPRLFGFAALTTVLLVGQMALGEAQYRTHLPWGLVLVHVALASVVWAATVALATLFWRPFSTLVPRT